MRAVKQGPDTQAITTRAIIIADIMWIVGIPLADAPEDRQMMALTHEADALRALATAGGDSQRLRTNALRGITLTENAVREHMGALRHARKRRSWAATLVAIVNPWRGGRRAWKSSEHLLDKLAQLRRELAPSSQRSSVGLRRKAKSRQDKPVESSLAG